MLVNAIKWSLMLWCLVMMWPARAGFLEMPKLETAPEAKEDALRKDLDIPAVKYRDPNPEAGPRLNVKAFKVQGIVEFPELGITLKSLNDLVENMRHNVMKDGEKIYSGFTLDELTELQSLLGEIETETQNQHVGPLEVQRLVFLVRDQKRRRGVSMGMLEAIAAEVTKYYRDRGFMLARAYIPEQKVRDGVVTITLLLGQLGQVTFDKNKRYKNTTLQSVFSDLIGKPVTADEVEEKLFYMNDLPGLKVQGYFAPGDQIGDAKLNVVTQKESAVDYNLRSDNHGSNVTGEYRAYADIYVNNPLRLGDQLQVSLLHAVEPEEATYGAMRYTMPLFYYRLKFNAGFSKNDFVSGLENSLNIKGVSKISDVGINFQIHRERKISSSVGLKFSQLETTQQYVTGSRLELFDEDKIHHLELNYSFDLLNEKKRSVHTGEVFLTHSTTKETYANQSLDDSAWLAGFDYVTLKIFKVPFTQHEARVIVRANVAYSGKQVAGVNQFSLAGPTRARGYRTNTFFTDDGVHLGGDWIFDAPDVWHLKEIAQPYFLFDGSYGIAHIESTQNGSNVKQEGTLTNLGFGTKLTWGEFITNISISAPIETHLPEEVDLTKVDDVKLYFNMQYHF